MSKTGGAFYIGGTPRHVLKEGALLFSGREAPCTRPPGESQSQKHNALFQAKAKRQFKTNRLSPKL